MTHPSQPSASAPPVAPGPSRTVEIHLRRALHAYRDGWEIDDQLTAAARMVGSDARHGGESAERMLVGLKTAWAALDETRALPPLEARDLLERLVTLTIAAYYDVRPTA